MQVVLAGASGLIGTALKRSLERDGHSVRALVRHAPSGPGEVRWDPGDRFLEHQAIDGADVVVCLSGAGVGDHRWTPTYKQTIVDSRVDTLRLIASTMAAANSSAALVSASAVGYYGDTGDRVVTEDAPPGDSFLADVCVQWEAAAAPARDAGLRTAALRTGLVLDGGGGLLKQLVPIVRAGVAGRLGSGRQYMPWISLADEVAAIRFVMEHELSGPVNLTGPAPVPNAEFMATLGHLLHRPTLVPTPALALRAVLGEFAGEILAGQRAVPAVLTEAGYRFQHDNLDSALRWALAR